MPNRSRISFVGLLVQVIFLCLVGACADLGLRPCNDSTFLVAQDIILGNKEVELQEAWRYSDQRFIEQSDALSLHLTLAKEAFLCEEAIKGQIIVTNKTNQPLTFARPHGFMLEPMCLRSNFLCVHLADTSGNLVRLPVRAFVDPSFRLLEPAPEDFSRLPPGESCVINFSWRLDKPLTPEFTPIPPGDYRMSVVLQAVSIGPLTDDEDGYYDIGAWIGSTKPSNELTLTILPRR